MVHFLPNEDFLPLGHAFEEACSRLEKCDELNRLINELDTCTTSRLGEGTITDDELRVANDNLQTLFNKRDAARRQVEDRIRMAFLTEQLFRWSLNPLTGQMERILEEEERERLAFGFAAVDTFSDDIFSPGPNTGGQPQFVWIPEFRKWLDAELPETGAPGRPQRTEPEPAVESEESPPQSTEPAVADPTKPVADRKRMKRRGPKPGTIDRFGENDRALFLDITNLKETKNLTAQEAARELGPRIKRRGSLESAVLRLARRYRKEVERKEGDPN
jgi:hypothetical protein